MKSKLMLGLLVFLTSCATSYQKSSDFFLSNKFGYKDYRIDENKFSVTFTANEFTEEDQVMKYALKRASELCLQNGYSHFVILSKKDAGRSVLVTTQYSSYVKHYAGVTIYIETYHNKISEEAIDASIYQNV